MSTALITEDLAIIGVYSPATIANAAKTSDIVDMSRFTRLVAILMTGDMASETIDFKIEGSAAAGFGSPADIKAATQLVASAAANDNKAVVIEITEQDLVLVNEAFRYVRASAITGGATGGVCSIILLGKAKYGKATHKTSFVLQTKY